MLIRTLKNSTRAYRLLFTLCNRTSEVLSIELIQVGGRGSGGGRGGGGHCYHGDGV